MSPGSCWSFAAGKPAQLTIALPHAIKPTSFTIGHVSGSLIKDRSSAPRELCLYVHAAAKL